MAGQPFSSFVAKGSSPYACSGLMKTSGDMEMMHPAMCIRSRGHILEPPGCRPGRLRRVSLSSDAFKKKLWTPMYDYGPVNYWSWFSLEPVGE